MLLDLQLSSFYTGSLTINLFLHFTLAHLTHEYLLVHRIIYRFLTFDLRLLLRNLIIDSLEGFADFLYVKIILLFHRD